MFKEHHSYEISLLKIIALISMTIDHIGFIIFKDIEIFRVIGRLAFILFAYILIHNYLYFSKNKEKFIIRLFLFALLSQPFFMYATGLIKINIFGLFAIFLTSVYLIENILRNIKNLAGRITSVVIIYILFLFLSWFFDYDYIGFIFMTFLYLSFKNQFYLIGVIMTIFVQYITNYKNMLGALSSLYLINAVIYINGKIERYFDWVKRNKYFFYVYYPFHLMVLKAIKIYLIKE